MDPSGYFLLPDGRLRAGWRLLIFVLLYLLAGMALSAVVGTFTPASSLATVAGVRIVATVSTTAIMMFFFDSRPFLAVGLEVEGGKWRELFGGFGMGFVLVESVIGIEWIAGSISYQSASSGDFAGVDSVASATAVLVVAAASEELLFRGYPFQRLVEGTGGMWAIGGTSVLFGVLHAGNPAATTLSVINTMLAGVLLSLAYLRTRALWLPIGFHCSWNWVLAVMGLPVSGIDVVNMPWRALPSSGRVWLYGGEYGPEGGVVCSVVLLVGIVYLLRRAPRRNLRKQNPPPPAAGKAES